MPWSTQHARRVMEQQVHETRDGAGVYADLRVTVYDSGMIVIGTPPAATPAGRRYGDEPGNAGRHDETHVVQDLTACLLELYRQADAHSRRRQSP
jgi:hypothetical protein